MLKGNEGAEYLPGRPLKTSGQLFKSEVEAIQSRLTQIEQQYPGMTEVLPADVDPFMGPFQKAWRKYKRGGRPSWSEEAGREAPLERGGLLFRSPPALSAR